MSIQEAGLPFKTIPERKLLSQSPSEVCCPWLQPCPLVESSSRETALAPAQRD
jgi:hypothetical protein